MFISFVADHIEYIILYETETAYYPIFNPVILSAMKKAGIIIIIIMELSQNMI